jgi:hypothetical protein
LIYYVEVGNFATYETKIAENISRLNKTTYTAVDLHVSATKCDKPFNINFNFIILIKTQNCYNRCREKINVAIGTIMILANYNPANNKNK